MSRNTCSTRRETGFGNPMLCLLAAMLSTRANAGGIFATSQPEWALDFPAGAIGQPAHFGPMEKTRGVLITEHSGRITLVSSQGERQLTMTLDLPVETPAVAANLLGDKKLSVVAVDAWGSVYCFDERGQRQWKFPRAVKSGEFRLPVFADLEGDGRLEILVPDSRGHLDVLDADGHLQLEIAATKYRVGVPSVGDVNGDGRAEIIFGTEAGEVYCLSSQGDVLWTTTLDGCFGRAFPLIADVDQDGHYEVYFPTAFNNAHPGLFALDAATGRQLWKAPSVLQSYRSTVVADLDGDGQSEILFGDKNSSLFCLDSRGQQHWTTQLPGRGIFFAPAVADLRGNGACTSFAVVRGTGSTGKSLYALDAAGKVVDELALPGGGGCSPILCRFEGRKDVSLLVLSSSGQLQCYRLDQNAAAARILWPGVRNDVVDSGFIASSTPVARKAGTAEGELKTAKVRKTAQGGKNKVLLLRTPPDVELVSVKTVRPDGSVRVQLLQKAETGQSPEPAFAADKPGAYDVTVRWHDLQNNAVLQAEHFTFRLDKSFKADATRLREVVRELGTIGREAPALKALTGFFEARVNAAWSCTTGSKSVSGFDEFRAQCDYSLRLARYLREHKVLGNVMLHQLPNPWPHFDAATFFGQPPARMNAISVEMLGNEYEPVAIAVSNLRPHPVTLRLTCGVFQGSTNRIEAKEVLKLHEVLSVRPDGTGELTEDPLPLLGEGQTVRLEGGETRKLWLTFHSLSLSAGTWRAMLKIGDIALPEPPVEVPMTLDLYPVRLPDRFTYR
jgi:outer membrane protein assembly factor BamB